MDGRIVDLEWVESDGTVPSTGRHAALRRRYNPLWGSLPYCKIMSTIPLWGRGVAIEFASRVTWVTG